MGEAKALDGSCVSRNLSLKYPTVVADFCNDCCDVTVIFHALIKQRQEELAELLYSVS